MLIKIAFEFDKSMTPEAAKLTKQQIKEAVEAAMERSDLLFKIAAQTGDHRFDVPAWNFA